MEGIGVREVIPDCGDTGIWGAPDSAIQQMAELQRLLSLAQRSCWWFVLTMDGSTFCICRRPMTDELISTIRDTSLRFTLH